MEWRGLTDLGVRISTLWRVAFILSGGLLAAPGRPGESGFCHEDGAVEKRVPAWNDAQVMVTSLRLVGVLFALYAFLFCLDLMGVAFNENAVAGETLSVWAEWWFAVTFRGGEGDETDDF